MPSSDRHCVNMWWRMLEICCSIQRNVPKIKSLGTFSKWCANTTLVCCYMVWVLYSPLPSQLLVKESVAGVAFCVCKLLCTLLRLLLHTSVRAWYDPLTGFVFYYIVFVSTRIGPWTWTEPSADEIRRSLQRGSPWRASVRQGPTSPFRLPRAAAGRHLSRFSLHNPTPKHRRSRFLGISLFKDLLWKIKGGGDPVTQNYITVSMVTANILPRLVGKEHILMNQESTGT